MPTSNFRRYRIDLQDIELSLLPELQVQCDSVLNQFATATVVGKHVCGQATDFVLKAIARANELAVTKMNRADKMITGIALATCCHHQCHFDNYCSMSSSSSSSFK